MGGGRAPPLSHSAHMSLASLQQQIQEVFKNQQEQLSMQLLQQKNAGIVSQEVRSRFWSASPCEYLMAAGGRRRHAARRIESRLQSGEVHLLLRSGGKSITTSFFAAEGVAKAAGRRGTSGVVLLLLNLSSVATTSQLNIPQKSSHSYRPPETSRPALR